MNSILTCHKCDLCLQHAPILDKVKVAEVMWVGLSAKKGSDSLSEAPLSPQTNTGKIIMQIEKEASNTTYYKTNLVKGPPLTAEHMLRYPLIEEKNSCYNNLLTEINIINPKIVTLLGNEVAKYVLKKQETEYIKLNSEFRYSGIHIGNIMFVPVHHPSYIHVYKRQYLDEYISGIVSIIQSSISYSIIENVV